MTKKQRNSSRKRCLNRYSFAISTYGTPTWIPAVKKSDDPTPANRQAAKIEAARERGAYGAMIRADVKTTRKARLKKVRREIQKLRKETKRAMAKG